MKSAVKPIMHPIQKRGWKIKNEIFICLFNQTSVKFIENQSLLLLFSKKGNSLG